MITPRRPGKRFTASAAPSGRPRSVAKSTAERLTSRLRSTMRHSSTSSWNTRCSPSAIALICERVSPGLENEQKYAPADPLRRGVRFLGEARLHQLRRTRGADRDHAPRDGGGEKVDRRAALPPRAQLLHAAPRPGGAEARHLCGLAAARRARRAGRGDLL